MSKNQLIFSGQEMLKRKSGNDLRLPSDCELLSLDIQGKTGVRIGHRCNHAETTAWLCSG